MRIKTLPLLVAAASIAMFSSQAATLTHSYDLNNSYADALGGPSLVPNGGLLGPTHYSFNPNQGLSLSGAIQPAGYSIELCVSLSDTDGWRKLIDFSNLTVDAGFYERSTSLAFYPIVTGPTGVFLPAVVNHVVLTRDAGTDTVSSYLNGVHQWSFIDSSGLAVFSATGNIGFFVSDDFATGQREASGGFVDHISIYEGALDATTVSRLYQIRCIPDGGCGALLAGSVFAGMAYLRRRN